MEGYTKTLADVRRRMVPGTRTDVINHVRPQANGVRVVEKNQKEQIAWRTAEGQVTWLKWPKASEVRIDGPDTVTFLVNGTAFVTIKFMEDETCSTSA